jgi:hypothetical protein
VAGVAIRLLTLDVNRRNARALRGARPRLGNRATRADEPTRRRDDEMTHLYGTAMPPTEYQEMHNSPRSVVGEIVQSISGNVVLRVGHELDQGWELSEHVVLTPDEALQFAGEIIARVNLSTTALLAQEFRVAAAACNGAAGVRRTIGEFIPDEGPDRVASEAATLESVAGHLAQLAQTLDVNRPAAAWSEAR